MFNRRGRKAVLLASTMLLVAVVVVVSTSAQEFLPVALDPLVRMPGTQPHTVTLESPNRCLNCHSGYNQAVEPGFNWQGSMMAQSSRDFLFFSAMTVAGQDSMWALGTPNAMDLCERCHFPTGWLEGRSDPPNASLMTGSDYDGVQCDFCHRMIDPFFETTYNGTREGDDWLGYWDETNASNTPSADAALETYLADALIAGDLTLFNGSPAYVNNDPFSPNYTEAGSGQFYISPDAAKRGSFADAAARHQMLYSRYHKSKYMCGTCHDVSNPALANLGWDGTSALPTETDSAFSYFHVERTFSEFMLSGYGALGGMTGIGPFDPAVFETSNPGNAIEACQDCHMRDVSGAAANKNGVIVRPDGSVEHPQSGQPLHDLTGGNVWVSAVLASAVNGSPNYDPVNDALINQGAGALTLDINQGLGIDPVALLAGSERAAQQLELAAAIENLTYDPNTGDLSFRVQNQTGHKLISGFPEGRRMFVNIKLYDAGGALLYEINPYDMAAGTLKGLDFNGAQYPYSTDTLPLPLDLNASEAHLDDLVYEMHPTSTLTGETETFHFVLADGRYKDNRIPPRGFDISGAAERQVVPVSHGVEDPNYFTAAEYAGGYDEVALTVPTGAESVEVTLYYQTTSREYVEFLRSEINGTASTLPLDAYLIQSHNFFSGLRAWGDTIWQLWTHNMNWPGAAPVVMASATYGTPAPVCDAQPPVLLSAAPDHQQVTLEWSDMHTTDSEVVGYTVYYDQASKAQLVTQTGTTTTYVDANLTDGEQYCYKITTRYAGCESGYSNIVCATPTNQPTPTVNASQIVTGLWQGKGANRTFVQTDTFTAGDEVVIRVSVIDVATSLPVQGAVVDIIIDGPQTVLLNGQPTSAEGLSEFTWKTSAPKPNGTGGTALGAYTITVTGITGTGITWDGVMTETAITLQ